MPENNLSARLRQVRHDIMMEFEPEDLPRNDDAAIGRELNDLRTLLGRIHAVHSSDGRHTGWGSIDIPRPPTARVVVPAAQPSESEDVVIPDDDDPLPETGLADDPAPDAHRARGTSRARRSG